MGPAAGVSGPRPRGLSGCPSPRRRLPCLRGRPQRGGRLISHPESASLMALARQTVALLQAARQLATSLPAESVLLMTETDLDWSAVRAHLGECKLLVAAEDRKLTAALLQRPELNVIDVDNPEVS